MNGRRGVCCRERWKVLLAQTYTHAQTSDIAGSASTFCVRIRTTCCGRHGLVELVLKSTTMAQPPRSEQRRQHHWQPLEKQETRTVSTVIICTYKKPTETKIQMESTSRLGLCFGEHRSGMYRFKPIVFLTLTIEMPLTLTESTHHLRTVRHAGRNLLFTYIEKAGI